VTALLSIIKVQELHGRVFSYDRSQLSAKIGVRQLVVRSNGRRYLDRVWFVLTEKEQSVLNKLNTRYNTVEDEPQMPPPVTAAVSDEPHHVFTTSSGRKVMRSLHAEKDFEELFKPTP
jgi:uncharacterized iron-regulated membrane protein